MWWAKLGAATLSVLLGIYFGVTALFHFAAVILNLNAVMSECIHPAGDGNIKWTLGALLYSLLMGVLFGIAAWFSIRWVPRKLFPAKNTLGSCEHAKRHFP